MVIYLDFFSSPPVYNKQFINMICRQILIFLISTMVFSTRRVFILIVKPIHKIPFYARTIGYMYKKCFPHSFVVWSLFISVVVWTWRMLHLIKFLNMEIHLIQCEIENIHLNFMSCHQISCWLNHKCNK